MSKKSVLFIIALLLAVPVVLASMLDQRPDQTSIDTSDSKEQERFEPEDCSGNITVELGPYIFELPRSSGISLSTKDQKFISSLHESRYDRPCDKNHFEKIHRINLVSYPIPVPFDVSRLRIGHVANNSEAPISQYQTLSNFIEQNKDELKIEKTTLPNGTEKYTTKNEQSYYFIPTEKADTKSEQPVTFNCSTPGFSPKCLARYRLPNGIYLSYRVNEDQDLTFQESQVRKYVLSLIKSSSNSN